MLLLIIILQFVETFSVAPRAIQVEMETSFLIRPSDLIKQDSVINSLRNLFFGLEKHFRTEPKLAQSGASQPEFVQSGPAQSELSRSGASQPDFFQSEIAEPEFVQSELAEPEFRAQKSGELTRFLEYVGEKLIKRDDAYLRQLIDALRLAVHDFYDRSNMTSYFKTKSDEFKLTNLVDSWGELSINDMKSHIKLALGHDNAKARRIVRYFDKFYNETDAEPLQDIAAHITGEVTNTTADIDRIVRGALNFIVFKRLRSLSDDERESLFKAIHTIINGKYYIVRSNKNFEIPSYEPANEKLQKTKMILENSYQSKHGLDDKMPGPNYRAQERSEEEIKTIENVPSHFNQKYLLTVEAKDGGIKISIPHKNDEKQKFNSDPIFLNRNKFHKRRSKNRAYNHIELRRRSATNESSVELLKREGDLLLKQVESEFNKIYNNSQVKASIQ
ncbi:uncharacterized protein LOC128682071 isoform X2 [Plodia interpunctella]|uniref:uncharacterized protein LOC128682071 isoform X2 n=1 Tax=Plodia interpunctella TaxID=58824 RepID=UPI0023678FF2|nr:uncharacterized protein LOC128682071 isoform X2 [Plodia interpunctella]